MDLDDQELAELIRSEAIDILVDLSGLISGQRLRVFVRKPSPPCAGNMDGVFRYDRA